MSTSPQIQYSGPVISPEVPWETRRHLQLLYQKLGNHTQAFQLQAQQIAGLKKGSTTTNIIDSGGSGGGGGGGSSSFVGQGLINDQTGATSYATQVGDNGILLVLNDASAVAVTLTTDAAPFYIVITNFGAGTATLTPSSGTINGGASLALLQNQTVYAACDSTNWETTAILPAGVTQLVAGTGISLSPAGGTGVVTVTATGGGGGVSRGALNTNANGSWWVWSDGVIEAWGSISVSATSTSLASGTITFPTPFITAVGSIQVTLVGFPRAASSDTGTVQVSLVGLAFADVNLQCSVPVGGGGVTFDQAVQVMWRAIGV